jgi:pimeloyl-ACP methyl ester carboxylesterase
MRNLLLVCVAFLLTSCTSNGERIDELARSAGLERAEFATGSYQGVVYMKHAPLLEGGLIVFLEGDGTPWRAGIEPSLDPTTKNPIALELMNRTPYAAAYITRPCYHGFTDANCTPDKWTGARYSETIVSKMTDAAREAARRMSASNLTIVGYSGGGTLAILLAERLERTRAVITLAANLDIDAWTQHHGYLPLTESLNPARSASEHRWPEIHIAGKDDKIVPIGTTATYFSRYPSAQHWVLENNGHVCCWLAEWTTLFERAMERVKEVEESDG